MPDPTTRQPIVCVVLPTFNEALNIERCIDGIFAQQERIKSHRVHVLVVDDNSPDGTQDVVRRLQMQFPALHLLGGKKKGLGDAYKRGMAEAQRTLAPVLIVQMDADGQHDAGLLPLFVGLAESGFGIVIGSRYVPGGSTPDFSWRRLLLSRMGNLMVRFLGGIARVRDCTSGFRCIRAELLAQCNLAFLSTRGYSFQSSLMCELVRTSAPLIEVPITFGDRRLGESKLSLDDQLEFLANVVRIRFRNSEEFFRYCFVGASGVLANLGCYIGLTRGAYISPEIASALAIEISIISNFLLHNFWTFTARGLHWGIGRRFLKFHLVAGFSGALNYLMFLLLYQTMVVNDIVANLAGIAVATLVNYLLNSFWTWSLDRK